MEEEDGEEEVMKEGAELINKKEGAIKRVKNNNGGKEWERKWRKGGEEGRKKRDEEN